MVFNLWSFLAISAAFMMVMLCIGIRALKQVNLKKLEVEELKIKQTNLKNAVADEVARNNKDISTRLEVLEAIITDKKYELNENITRLNT